MVQHGDVLAPGAAEHLLELGIDRRPVALLRLRRRRFLARSHPIRSPGYRKCQRHPIQYRRAVAGSEIHRKLERCAGRQDACGAILVDPENLQFHVGGRLVCIKTDRSVRCTDQCDQRGTGVVIAHVGVLNVHDSLPGQRGRYRPSPLGHQIRTSARRHLHRSA